jgi:hypothetical protein
MHRWDLSRRARRHHAAELAVDQDRGGSPAHVGDHARGRDIHPKRTPQTITIANPLG